MRSRSPGRSREDLLDGLAAQRRDLLRRLERLERFERGEDDVDRVVRPERLGDDVVDPGQLEDGAHRAAGDDAGPRRGGLEHDVAGADLHVHLVRDRLLDHRHGDQVFAGLLDALADRLGHFTGLADREPDAPLLVADDDQRAEREALSALHDLRDAVDADDRLFEALVVAIATATKLHGLKLQTRFARRLGERRDATVILVARGVEHDRIDPRRLRALGDRRADLLGGLEVRAQAAVPLDALRVARDRHYCFPALPALPSFLRTVSPA